MADVRQEEITDTHGIVRLHYMPPEDDDNEVNIDGLQIHWDVGGLSKNDNESEDDGGSESGDSNNDQVPGDPTGGPYRSTRPRGSQRPLRTQRPMGPVVPVIMNFHVKCPNFSARDDEGAKTHIVQQWLDELTMYWRKSKKNGSLVLILYGDAHLWYDSLFPVGNNWNNLWRLFWHRVL